MKAFGKTLGRICFRLNLIAAGGIVVTMVLVVGNILLRMVKLPILGTYEYVGFLTAAVIGLSLAYCAVQDGHIAIGFILDKLPHRVQLVVSFLGKALVFVLTVLVSWHVFKYARSIALNGEVSPTTRAPFYPFVYLLGFGLLALSLVNFAQFVIGVKGARK